MYSAGGMRLDLVGQTELPHMERGRGKTGAEKAEGTNG